LESEKRVEGPAKGDGPPRGQPRGPWPVMQLRLRTNLTSEEYANQQAWQGAMLDGCPLHPKGGCTIRRHGSYSRKEPVGARIARFYCRMGQTTFSLLPDFAAARLSAELAEVEHAVDVAGAAPTLASAARDLRPELNDERSAVRWLRRRVQAIRSALTALVTSVPELFGTAACLGAVRERLGLQGSGLLVQLRAVGESMLPLLRSPLGFFHRSRACPDDAREPQHKLGPDPGGHHR
jgi:hypothetical protein